jgi:hypothetical protein
MRPGMGRLTHLTGQGGDDAVRRYLARERHRQTGAMLKEPRTLPDSRVAGDLPAMTAVGSGARGYGIGSGRAEPRAIRRAPSPLRDWLDGYRSGVNEPSRRG